MNFDKFHVITGYSNPLRYRTRRKLYDDFKGHMECAGVKHLTVELALGDRPFEVTTSNDLQIRTFNELWYKENLLNLAIQRLPPDWEYVAWIDSDISFSRTDWAIETVHLLQHYMVVQMFSHAIDLGPKEEPIQNHNGFVWSWFQNHYQPPTKSGYGSYGFWHPGYAWAARREAIDHLGGLIDWAILGSGDHHMALGLIGKIEKSIPKGISDRYRKKLMIWQERAENHIKKDIGFMDGLVLHHWHGSKKKRYYRERWQILIDNAFDPDTDLKRDSSGIWQLNTETPRQIRLRDEIREYFRSRDEDGTEI